MSTVLSTINLKGGVGKTTTTVGLAEMFAKNDGNRVLVIDLDPQTNATVMLIDEQRVGRARPGRADARAAVHRRDGA